MNTVRDLVFRSKRASARRVSMMLGLALAGSCGGQTLDQSTETGNPPLVASGEIAVDDQGDGEVRVTGSADAVEPGGAPVVVTNESTGDTVTVDSRRDGSFSAMLSGSLGDVYRVDVESGGDTASATIAPDEASSPTVRACEKICAGPSECGARETLFPIIGCDCDASVCECTEPECVEACLDDLAMYREKTPECGLAVADLEACMLEAPCESFGKADDSLREIASCDRALEFEERCGFGPPGTCSDSYTEGGVAGSTEVLQCEVLAACDGTNYGIDCSAVGGDEPEYECNCRVDGRILGTFRSPGGCRFPDPPLVEGALAPSSLAYLDFRCGLELSNAGMPPSGCGSPSYSQLDGSTGDCAISTTCDDGEYAVDCAASTDGVLCSCRIDGEEVGQRLLHADGCAGASVGGERSDSDLVRMMNAICEFRGVR